MDEQRQEPLSKRPRTSEGQSESCTRADQGYKERLDTASEIASRLCSHLRELEDRSEPVVRLTSAEDLRKAFEESGVAVDLAEAQQPVGSRALLQALDVVLKHSVRTGHPLFFNQLYGRADPVAVAADWLLSATNTNVFTYEVAPVYSMVEVEILQKIANKLGGDFAESHDGLFVAGGSISNLYSMHLARFFADPEVGRRGLAGGPRLVAYVSEQCHYSFLKSARLIGIGSDNLISVESDAQGRMKPSALEAAISESKKLGYKPFFVGATAGTTVVGAYDPFVEIGEICKRHGIWHHVDGCWGGGAILSDRYRHCLRGAESADSFAWNPHKMSGVGLQCSAFLTRHKGLLARANAAQAAYLFQPDKLNADLDIGDKTIQCGRRGDAFKLWVLWKSKGDEGMQRTVDRCFDLARFMANRIREASATKGDWKLVYEPSCGNVCFWYVPTALRPFDFATATKEKRDAIHKVAPLIKNEMQRRGDAMIGFQAVNGRPNFFRMVFAAADIVEEEDITKMLDRMAKIGEEQYSKATVVA